jgi:hypothetical protein
MCGLFLRVGRIPVCPHCILAHYVLTSQGRICNAAGRHSNRMFWTKAVKVWTACSEWQRVLCCAAYFRCGGFTGIEAFDVTADDGNDPMYVVQGRRPSSSGL